MTSTKTLFEREVLPQLPALYGLALKYTHSESEAEDLIQDMLIKAYKNFASFEIGSNCRAWLCRILTNTFINKYRHKIRENAFIENTINEALEKAEILTDLPDDLSCLDQGDLTEHDYFFSFPDEIVHAFKSISKEFRSIIIMADLQEMSYREISDILHIPIGTVMSRLSRARQTMRNILSGYAHTVGYA